MTQSEIQAVIQRLQRLFPRSKWTTDEWQVVAMGLAPLRDITPDAADAVCFGHAREHTFIDRPTILKAMAAADRQAAQIRRGPTTGTEGTPDTEASVLCKRLGLPLDSPPPGIAERVCGDAIDRSMRLYGYVYPALANGLAALLVRVGGFKASAADEWMYRALDGLPIGPPPEAERTPMQRVCLRTLAKRHRDEFVPVVRLQDGRPPPRVNEGAQRTAVLDALAGLPENSPWVGKGVAKDRHGAVAAAVKGAKG